MRLATSEILTSTPPPAEAHPDAAQLVTLLFTALSCSWTGDLENEALWGLIAPQCATCIQCMVAYHDVQQDLVRAGAALAAECLLLRAALRLEALFCALNSSIRCLGPNDPSDLSALLLTEHLYGVLEALQYDHLLKDNGTLP